MILTVTLNPTIDRVLFVRDFHMQDVVRAEREVVSPSGKGIDVSIILHTLDARTRALSLNAGYSGQILAAMLDEQGVPYDFVEASGQTRTATLLTDLAEGVQSTILAHTLTATPENLDQLSERVEHYGAESWGLVCAGSVPPGMAKNAYSTLLALGRQHGLVTLLDSSGDGLLDGIGGKPDILKVNQSELRALSPLVPVDVAVPVPGSQAIPAEMARLIDILQARVGEWATQAIVLTLGSAGALAVTDEGVFYAPAPAVAVISPAGAGDAVSAGLMLGRRRGANWANSLALGVAAAAAVVMNEGTAVCTRAEVAELLPRVKVFTV